MKINIQIFNNEGKVKWGLNIYPTSIESEEFKVEENSENTLFNNDNFPTGKSYGEALDNFLAIENDLINNL